MLLIVVAMGPAMLPVAQESVDVMQLSCGANGVPPDLIPEIRKAASLAANQMLYQQVQRDFEALFGPSLAESAIFADPSSITLERLYDARTALASVISNLESTAQGSSKQCREIAEPSSFENSMLNTLLSDLLDINVANPLSQDYLFQINLDAAIALKENGVTSGIEFDEQVPGAILEQVQIFADGISHAPSYEIGLSRSAIPFFPIFLILGLRADDELAQEALSPDRWAGIACGRNVQFDSFGLQFDGSFFIQSNDSEGYPFRQTASEIWSFTSVMINLVLLLFDPSFAETFHNTAVNGCSPELRWSASNLYLAIAAANDPNKLWDFTLNGNSEELQLAAASRLIPHLADDEDRDDGELQSLALTLGNKPLRFAAGYALGLRWLRLVEAGELDLGTRFEFPPNGKVNLIRGTLTQYATVHSGVHPELAQGAILPLFHLFLRNSESP
jgi:hypothetical protein